MPLIRGVNYLPVPPGVNPWSFVQGTAPGVPMPPMTFRPNSVLVNFRVRVRTRLADGTLSRTPSWRTLWAVVNVDTRNMDKADYMNSILRKLMKEHLNDWAGYDGDDAPIVDMDSDDRAVVEWLGSRKVLSAADIAAAVAAGGHSGTLPGGIPVPKPAAATSSRDSARHWLTGRRMHGTHHRSFKYYIPGADVPTLNEILPEMYAAHAEQCQRMCVYEMLRDRNPPRGMKKFRCMQPEAVHRWFVDNGMEKEIGSITDGVTAEQIQRHAEHFGYPHAALDVTRSLLLLHYPSKPSANLKTIAYTVIGDHAIPFTDADAISSIMTSAGLKLGRRRVTNQSFANEGNIQTHEGVNRGRVTTAVTTSAANRKRSRSASRAFQVERTSGTTAAIETTQPHEILDFELDEREEGWDIVDHPDHLGEGTDINKRKRALVYPTLQQTERFVTFQKETGQQFIRDHLKPWYKHGPDHREVYYFVCTDESDIQFLYDYCIHVLKYDPTTSCRSYNGRAFTLIVNNVIWRACKEWEMVRTVHNIFQPNDPFRWSGLASYAMRLLIRKMAPGASRHHTIWDCMSQYPPNLMRLLDTHHPYQRPVLSQMTYHAPYGIPDTMTEDAVVPVLIPDHERRRMDMIRSYTSCLLAIDNDNDSFPVHDVSNRLIPFDHTLHAHIPVGYYLVVIPDHATLQQRGTMDSWQRLPGFVRVGPDYPTVSVKRMLTHRMVRALIHRGLIDPATDIELICIGEGNNLYTGRSRALSRALAEIVRDVYKHPDLQSGPNCDIPKSLINQLIGLCNGTTVPFSGMRLVFHNLEELWQLSLRVFTDDQLQNVHITRNVGTDGYWDVPYDHFEMCHTGITHRHFHLQPVYNMVLETQAVHLYDVSRPIPLYNLIQLNVDAVEFRVRTQDTTTPWYTELMKTAVKTEDYQTMNTEQILCACMGAYKPENPKPPNKWRSYHYDYSRRRLETAVTRFRIGTDYNALQPEPIRDPEAQDYIPCWRDTLRIETPGVLVREPHYIHDCARDWFINGTTHSDYSGILLTGPAGTGKTHWLRELYRVATNLGASVTRAAFTHSACMQMGPDAVTLSSLFGLDATSDSRRIVCFSRKFLSTLRTLKIDLLVIDEISMIPLYLLEVLCLYHRMHTSCRIVLSGDFCQLPPVEPGFDRAEGWSYFRESDIFDYLIMDRTTSKPGTWIQLTECMRTDDPLLQNICKNPEYVTKELSVDQFPVGQVQIWRFICATNRTRKACNTFCMLRWLDYHPQLPTFTVDLAEVYADFRMTVTNTSGRFDRSYYIRECIDMLCRANREEIPEESKLSRSKCIPSSKWYPRHWSYLQGFVYTPKMEVVCRNTLREYQGNPNSIFKQGNTDRSNNPIQIVNNRRARIVDWDNEKQFVSIQWTDVLMHKEIDPEYELPDPLVLTLYDFAFNFVPGFCTTVHMAQGETIREHYGILDWGDIRTKQSMAYVAVTRPSHPKFLHILPFYAPDPWDTRTNADPYFNVVKRLYTKMRMDYKDVMSSSRLTMHHIRSFLDRFRISVTCDTVFECHICHAKPLKTKAYLESDPLALCLDTLPSWWNVPDTDSPFCTVCSNCKSGNQNSLGRVYRPVPGSHRDPLTSV